MGDIHIHRKHALGLAQARKMAFAWAEDAQNKHEMSCNYEEGTSHDCVSFSRAGVNGTLTVSHDDFELSAKLGFLLGVFKDKIEAEITKKLDAMLASEHAKHGTKDVVQDAAQDVASKPVEKTTAKK